MGSHTHTHSLACTWKQYIAELAKKHKPLTRAEQLVSSSSLSLSSLLEFKLLLQAALISCLEVWARAKVLNIFVLPWHKWLNCRPNDKLQQQRRRREWAEEEWNRLKYSTERCAITLIVPRIFVGVRNCKYLLEFISTQHSLTHTPTHRGTYTVSQGKALQGSFRVVVMTMQSTKLLTFLSFVFRF